MTANQFIERAIRVPFSDKGRSYLGFDCWGLVVCYYRDVLDIALPFYDDYDTVRNHKALVRLFTANAQKWRKVPDAIDGRVALIFRRGLPLQLGLPLHCEEGVGTGLVDCQFGGGGSPKNLLHLARMAARRGHSGQGQPRRHV